MNKEVSREIKDIIISDVDKQISAEKPADPESKVTSRSTTEQLELHGKEADRAEAALKTDEGLAIPPIET